MAATLLHPVPHHHLSVRLGMWMLSWLGSPLQQHSSLDEAAARHCNLTSPPGKKEKKKSCYLREPCAKVKSHLSFLTCVQIPREITLLSFYKRGEASLSWFLRSLFVLVDDKY